MAYKGVLFFSTTGGAESDGFSEVYHLQANNLNDAAGNLQTIATNRLGLMAADVTLEHGRVSFDGGARKVKLLNINTQQMGTFISYDQTSVTLKSMDSEVAILCRQEAADGTWSNRYLHSIPLVLIAGQRNLNWNEQRWASAFGTYVGALRQYTTLQPKADGLVAQPIVAVTQQRLTSRRVGRVFGVPSGRRSMS